MSEVKEEAGGRKEGADTALKTKTPHVNVGKNKHMQFMQRISS